AGPDDRRNVLDGADHAGIDHRLTDLGRIRIDEPDDLDAEIVTTFVEFLCEAEGHRVGAHEQQSLAWTEPAADPFPRQAPADDAAEDEQRRDEEHAPADDEVREPVVDGGKDE